MDIYKPEAFIFENVMGILSAKPGDQLITDRIYKAFDKIGYTISDDLRKDALFDMSYYGIPQERKRVIIYGVPSEKSEKINEFYRELRIHKSDEQKNLGRHLDKFTKFKPLKYKNDLSSFTAKIGLNFSFPILLKFFPSYSIFIINLLSLFFNIRSSSCIFTRSI